MTKLDELSTSSLLGPSGSYAHNHDPEKIKQEDDPGIDKPRSHIIDAVTSSLRTDARDQTAWLDGLRGVASYGVFLFHLFQRLAGEGGRLMYCETPESCNWWRLPYIRLIYSSGALMVCLFFIISGFVLTHSGFKLIRQRNFSKLLSQMSSSIFRRLIRLWLPCIFVQVVALCSFGVGIGIQSIEGQGSFVAQFRDWMWHLNKMVNPFAYSHTWSVLVDPYHGDAWTIPLEAYGSFVVYLTVIAIARMPKYRMRLAVMLVLQAFAFFNGAWHVSLFLYGTMLSDYHVEYINGNSWHKFSEPGLSNTIFWSLVWFSGLSIANSRELREPFGPARKQDHYLVCFSASLIVTALLHLSMAQAFFMSWPIRYLGRVSFGLYLLHSYILGILLENFGLQIVFEQLLETNDKARGFMWGLLVVVETPILLIAAGVFERMIDRPSVGFAKWLEQRLIEGDHLIPMSTAPA